MKNYKIATALIGSFVLGVGGATLYTQAAAGAAVYSVYEANIKDEAAYTAALPEVDKLIKEHNGQRVAGGFNKTKTISGSPAGNRFYVILKWDDMATFRNRTTAASRRGLKGCARRPTSRRRRRRAEINEIGGGGLHGGPSPVFAARRRGD